jgi:hypothetical protein
MIKALDTRCEADPELLLLLLTIVDLLQVSRKTTANKTLVIGQFNDRRFDESWRQAATRRTLVDQYASKLNNFNWFTFVKQIFERVLLNKQRLSIAHRAWHVEYGPAAQ